MVRIGCRGKRSRTSLLYVCQKSNWGSVVEVPAVSFALTSDPDHYGLPFVISTGAKRSGEICGFFSSRNESIIYGRLKSCPNKTQFSAACQGQPSMVRCLLPQPQRILSIYLA
jgi:hypothetical protein